MGNGQKQSETRILDLIDALDQRQRDVILLRFQNELSYGEIGELTGLSVSTVGLLMHTGLKALKKMYDETTTVENACGGAR